LIFALTISLVSQAAIVAAFLLREQRREAAVASERKDWTVERQVLLNRIKPETAQPVTLEPAHDPEAVDMFNDDSFWKAKDALERFHGELVG
jgi:hypothetical protein